ncbi:penicillin-binding protein 2 [Candidatus Margulisiibacteriota bacterium]
MNKNRQEQFFALLFLIFWLILSTRLIYLQLFKGSGYRQTSAEIRARLIPSTAPRGIIYDRYGEILATNRPAYAIYVMPSELKNKEKSLAKLAQITGIPLEKINSKINKSKYFFEPVLIKDYAPFPLIALIEEEKDELPGVSIGNKTIRYYPKGPFAAHVLGHVGEVSRQELIDQKNKRLRLGDIIGLSGIEKTYDIWLRGIGGGQHIEVDAQGRPIKRTQSLLPIPGKEIYLTLDAAMQKKAEQLMTNYNGAVIVLDVNSGEVLTLVSKPGFDPNLFAGALTKRSWQKLITKSQDPFHNRAITAYPPGSTFKLVTALAALEERLTSVAKQFFCRGFFQFGRRKALCWTTHNQLSFFDAIVNSCDVVFYHLGLRLGIDNINKYAVSYGLGSPTGIDIPLESSGLIPSEEWKLEKYRKPWFPGDSMNAAIGQGYIQATPLQMALLIAGIANSSNIVYRPFLCKKVVNNKEQTLLANEPYEISRLSFKASNLNILREAMRYTVLRGTGKAALTDQIAIAGKTGTAEDPPRKKPHAWFTCYAPYQTPELAVVVFLEGSGHGGSTAAPIARELIKWWHKNRKQS